MLEIGASTWEYLAMHVALLGVDFAVSEPPELLEHLHKLGARLQHASTNL
jgi:hypothetical protein